MFWGRILVLIGVVQISLVVAAGAQAAPLLPQVDFRSETFADANLQHSFSTSVDGIGFTVSAWRQGADGELVAAQIWWDEVDGLGIWGGEDDEIDFGETLTLTFDNQIGLSHVFFSDLFDQETWNGLTYSESVRLVTDLGYSADLTAADVTGTWGNAANGEGLFTLDKTVPVTQLSFTVPGSFGSQNFALLGFIDPPVGVPLPPSLALLALGTAAILGLSWRRRTTHA